MRSSRSCTALTSSVVVLEKSCEHKDCDDDDDDHDEHDENYDFASDDDDWIL